MKRDLLKSRYDIIHVGPSHVPGTCTQRARALADLGHNVERVYSTLPGMERNYCVDMYQRIRRRMGYPVELCKENEILMQMAQKFPPHIIWIEKGLTIRGSTLRSIKKEHPEIFIISYSPDDMMNPRNQSFNYLSCIKLYDMHVTTKTYNIQELQALGARRVEYVQNAFDPHIHRPVDLTPDDFFRYGSDISFVGDFEFERSKSIVYIVEKGFKVRVWGRPWEKFKYRHPNLTIEKREVFGDEYAKVLCSSKINMGFLRKVNRDRQTTRSIEIPACGAFMLAERTEEHTNLFSEGVEAEFFADHSEMVEKIRYYLENDGLRKKIGQAGRRKCLDSGYSNQDIVNELVGRLDPALFKM